MTLHDTICAISTPPGVGGIAVARVSGHDAFPIVTKIWKGKKIELMDTHTAHLGTIVSSDGEILDQAVVTIYRSPGSFTGEDVAEVSVHGSRYVQRELLNLLIQSGARLADAGEFTRRAFIAGKLNLAQAEAVADVIASTSRAAHRIAVSQIKGGFSRRISELRQQLIDIASLLELELDFSEEEVEFASRTRLSSLAREILSEVNRLRNSFAAGNAIKNGIPVAIVGATNAGKSSLLNALIGDNRAIVSDIHGTTRDTIEETIELDDYTFRFIDTAGIRTTTDLIEKIGIDRSHDAMAKARIVILVIDATVQIDPDIVQSVTKSIVNNPSPGYLIIACNKTDITTIDDATSEKINATLRQLPVDESHYAVVDISATTGYGLESLHQQLIKAAKIDCSNDREGILVTNVRHSNALASASIAIERIINGVETGIPGDLIAQDLREAISTLATITGEITSNEILNSIFSRFCIGK